MPKTTKRAATKRAAQIARAHATQLPKLEVKESPIRRSPGYKRPARGLARYPWATVLTILIIALGIYMLYFYHVGPFALPKPQTKKVAVTSVCAVSSILSKITDTSAAPSQATFDATKHSYPKAPTMSIDTKKTYCAGINTNRGLIVVELDPSLAPNTVNNFVFLAQNKFYDGMVFHRVIQTGTGLHIIQSGDPLGKDLTKRGTGGPGYKFADEPVKGNYSDGAIAMANSGPNTNGSQFFICTGDDTSLPKSYNLFGRVVQGLDIAKKIQGPGDDAATKSITPDIMNHVIVVAA
ncbi:MAG: hypothetical protein NVS4B11_39530 [Ktedonobacteraceae bacterium]